MSAGCQGGLTRRLGGATLGGMVAWVLTVSRLPLSAAFAVLAGLSAGGRPGSAATAGLLALALAAELTDLLDGPAARRSGTASELGGLVDPLCDSLGRLTMYFAAALAGWVWIGVPLVMAGRDIVVAYVRIVMGRTGGRTSARLSGKLKAIVQGVAIVAFVLLARWPDAQGRLQWLAAGVVMAVTLWSLADYLRGGWPAIVALYRQGRPGR